MDIELGSSSSRTLPAKKIVPTNLLVEDVRAPLSLKPWLIVTLRRRRAVLALVDDREQYLGAGLASKDLADY